MRAKVTAAIAIFSAILAGCTQTTPTFQTGKDAELTFDGLTRLDGTVMDVAWARKDIDLTGYRKVMLQNAGVEFRPVSGPYSGRAGTTSIRRSGQSVFPMDEATQELVIQTLSIAFREELAQSTVFEIVDEPGPDVLLVRGGLLDVISNVPPDTIGRSRNFLSRVGEATLVLEVRDSESKTVYARGVDRRAAEQSGGMGMESNTVTNRAQVRRLGKRWGQTLREALDALLTGETAS